MKSNKQRLREVEAIIASMKPIKVFKKTNVFWVYDTATAQRQLMEVN